MSRINDLIRRATPEGVEFRLLGEIAELVRGNGMPKTDLIDEGVGAIHYGQIYTRYSTWTTNTISFVAPETAARLAVVKPGDLIITNTSENVEDVGKAVAWLGEDWIVTGGHATVVKHNQDAKYLAYWFQSESFLVQKKALATGTKVIDVSAKQLATVRIPVPPLAVQREIARILDEYTALEIKLKGELESEIETRRRQYDFYRDRLLTFTGSSAVPRVSLGEVCGVFDGTHQTPVYTDSGVPFVSVENIRNLAGTKKHISHEDFQKIYRVKPSSGDVLMTRIGTIGACAVVANDDPLAYYVTLALLRPASTRLRSGFLRHVIESGSGSRELRKRTLTTAVPIKINLGEIGKIEIPLPSLEQQDRIVATLDRFDDLISELRVALPAEARARRKQYEYYRDKLFSFEESVA